MSCLLGASWPENVHLLPENVKLGTSGLQTANISVGAEGRQQGGLTADLKGLPNLGNHFSYLI
jgi:hypothetical protein